MDPKNTDEAPSPSSSLSLPHAHEGAPDHPSSSSSSLPAADSTLRRTSPQPSSSSYPAIFSILYCDFCGDEFNDFEDWVGHIMWKHPRHLDEDKSPSPSSPPPSPASPWILSHGDGPVFNCFECDEVFRNFQDWLDHSANSHPFEPPHEFVVPQSPEAAPPQERTVRFIRCTLCRQTFLPQEEMCVHVRTNARAMLPVQELSSTERICHLCGRIFANSDECRRHVWDAHSPIITICAQVWSQRTSSSSAVAAPPSSSSVAEAEGPRFNCRSCSSSFANGRELTNHVWAAHPPIITMWGQVVAPQPPAGSGVGGPVVGAPAQEAAEPSRETAAGDEFLSLLDSGGFLVDEPPPNDG